MHQIRWGIIGAGHIAAEFADGVVGSVTGELVAVASRGLDKAAEFAGRYPGVRAYGSYQELLEDDGVDAVYIATPHPMHGEWVIKAAEAGKHILVEKPISLNRAEALTMIDAARRHDVFLMEAFMYRCHPQIEHVLELIKAGALGQVQHISASFSYRGGADITQRHLAPELGGGGILDVGCYPASMARLLAGAAHELPFVEPLEVKGCGHIGETGIDEWAIASLRFPGDIVAQLSTGIRLNQHEHNTVTVTGTAGYLTITDPWIPSRWNRDPVRLLLKRFGDAEVQTLYVEAPEDLYSYEADMVGRHIAARQAPAMTWNDTLGNMDLLDRWRREVGVVYERELGQAAAPPLSNRPLRVSRPAMQYGELPGLGKPLSRLIMGADSNNDYPFTAMLFDDYFELGGNTFDTSHGYGNPNGACERNLGQWIKNRGVRDSVVVIEKGANAPNDNAEGLSRELLAGLDRLQLDYVDIYMVHRDNEAVPIGEWVEVLNHHLRAGHMKVFGLSNFSVERLQAFAAYAAEHGLQSFAGVSNQFSLAQLQAPIWDMHLVSSGDSASRQWFEQTGTPLLPWSSQARGFFTDRAGRDVFSDPEVVRCWYSEANFVRRDRAVELAAKLGVEPINIALAYVLNQSFPTFPLIGARQPTETRSCLRALQIELSPEDVAWLRADELGK